MQLENLKREVLKALTEDLQNEKISTIRFMSAMWLLSQAPTEEDFVNALYIFSDQIPSFSKVLKREELSSTLHSVQKQVAQSS